MAGSVNKVIIIGRLGKDPEVRNFQNGGKVVNLRLATGERYKDREGNMQEKTEWHSVAIFNEKLGEIAEKYLRKGSQVYIEGQLETRKWGDPGAEKYSTEIVLRNFRGELTLLDSRGQGGGGGGEDEGGGYSSGSGGGAPPARSGAYGGGGGARPASPAPARGGWDSNKKNDLDDDIPF